MFPSPILKNQYRCWEEAFGVDKCTGIASKRAGWMGNMGMRGFRFQVDRARIYAC